MESLIKGLGLRKSGAGAKEFTVSERMIENIVAMKIKVVDNRKKTTDTTWVLLSVHWRCSYNCKLKLSLPP